MRRRDFFLSAATLLAGLAMAPDVSAVEHRTSGTKAAYVAWIRRFKRPDGRIVDDANGDVSHSEGQGYGMLLAVFNDDRQSFAEMWEWTSENLGTIADR